ncbi:hypothetical protein J4408_01635 [Candidatus Pacearchaeota archaeon]|nr:hypothetical protein [Candidatus Pacearchaeota archaeon]
MELKSMAQEKSYIYLERYVNEFKKVANEVSKDFCAIQGSQSYTLPYTKLSRNKVSLFISKPNKLIYKKFVGKNVNFFIHPDMLYEIKPTNLNWKKSVQPTSSTRTVLIDKNIFVKLHLNKRLSRYIRRLTKSSVIHSIKVSSELEQAILKKNIPESFAFLPETIGIVYRNFGMLVRETQPRPSVREKRIIVPMFSLYSRDLNKPSDKPLFVQIVERRKIDPMDFLINEIIWPLFKNMSFFINNYGLLLEPHGQNILAEIAPNLKITRIVHRDFQSMYIDLDIRKKKKLSNKFNKHLMGTECKKIISYSLVYDNYVGRYMLDKFVKLINKEWNIPKRVIISKIKESFKRFFDQSLFPKNYFYTMAESEFKNNKTVFTRHKNPRYR